MFGLAWWTYFRLFCRILLVELAFCVYAEDTNWVVWRDRYSLVLRYWYLYSTGTSSWCISTLTHISVFRQAFVFQQGPFSLLPYHHFLVPSLPESQSPPLRKLSWSKTKILSKSHHPNIRTRTSANIPKIPPPSNLHWTFTKADLPPINPQQINNLITDDAPIGLLYDTRDSGRNLRKWFCDGSLWSPCCRDVGRRSPSRRAGGETRAGRSRMERTKFSWLRGYKWLHSEFTRREITCYAAVDSKIEVSTLARILKKGFPPPLSSVSIGWQNRYQVLV